MKTAKKNEEGDGSLLLFSLPVPKKTKKKAMATFLLPSPFLVHLLALKKKKGNDNLFVAIAFLQSRMRESKGKMKALREL